MVANTVENDLRDIDLLQRGARGFVEPREPQELIDKRACTAHSLRERKLASGEQLRIRPMAGFRPESASLPAEFAIHARRRQEIVFEH